MKPTTQNLSILGDKFEVILRPNGSAQINIKNIRDTADLDRCKLLIEANDNLVKAGFPQEQVQVKLASWDPRTRAWRPWPCIWIATETQPNTGMLDEERMLKLMAAQQASTIQLLANLGVFKKGVDLEALTRGATTTPTADQPADEEAPV
jgi:hypothetical protein